MKTISLMVCLLFTRIAIAQLMPKPVFVSGDKVCFVGNSITNNGEFYQFIYLYYATRFPGEHIRFVNCGISGDIASGILKRLDNDVLVHQPTYTVLMVGMNDVRRDLYAPRTATSKDPTAERAKALQVYERDAEAIVKRLTASTKLILEKPTIYDEVTPGKTTANTGVNGALANCGEMIGKLAEKYNTRVVDYYSLMNRVNDKLHETEPAATIIGPDRVHPGAPGHLLMAYQFLKALESPQYVSRIVIGKDADASNRASLNCEIRDYSINKQSISFTCKEYSLPFPVKPDAAAALNWVPFTEELNQELLQVSGIDDGEYELFIDGRSIATYTAKQLQEGVNLVQQTNTPQYQQAAGILKLCIDYRKQESAIRNIKFVEVGRLAAGRKVTDTTEARDYLNRYLDSASTNGHYDFYKTQFSNYLLNKPREAAIHQQLDAIAEKIYQTNKPGFHKFLLKRK